MDSRAFAHSGLEVREGRRGRGVFAARAFAAGDEVEICPSVEVPRAETSGGLVMAATFCANSLANCGWAFSPVPTAVPPCASA